VPTKSYIILRFGYLNTFAFYFCLLLKMKKTKTDNFKIIKDTVDSFQFSFTIYDIRKITGLHQYQVKRYLKALEELGYIKYSETAKIYVKNYER